MKRFALKRITALVLALIMTLSLCPVTAFATTTEGNAETVEYTVTNETDASLPYTASSVYNNYSAGVWNAVDDGPTAGNAISSHVASVGFNIDYFVIETAAAGTLSIFPNGSTEEVTFKLMRLVSGTFVEVSATGEYAWDVEADGIYFVGALTGYDTTTGASTAGYLPSITATFTTSGYVADDDTGEEEQVEYTPLYWTEDGGATYHNSIDEPIKQKTNNNGYWVRLYTKDGDTYTAIDEATFGNSTITKLSNNIGFFGWTDDGRLFWNTENVTAGTEGGVVFTIGDVQYLVNLYVLTLEDGAAAFVAQYAKDLNGNLIDISNLSWATANRIREGMWSWLNMSSEEQTAANSLLDDITFDDMLAAAYQWIYPAADAFVSDYLSADGNALSTITAGSLWNLRSAAMVYPYLSDTVKVDIDSIVNANFASLKDADATLTLTDLGMAAVFILNYVSIGDNRVLITSLDANSSSDAMRVISRGEDQWATLTTVQKTAVNKSLKNADANAQTYEQMLAFFQNTYTATGAFGWNGVCFFTGLEGTVLTNDGTFSLNNGVVYGSVIGDAKTVYLTASMDSELFVTAAGSDTNLVVEQEGKWKDFGGNLQKVYKMTMEKPANGDTVEYTVKRTIPGVTGADLITVNVEFVPEYTCDGEARDMWGVFAFVGLDGEELICDESVKTWGNGEEHHMYIVCDDVASKTIYLAASKWNTLSVSGVSDLTTIGAWVRTGTNDNGERFEEPCNVYALTVAKPETGNTAEYTVTNAWTWYDENDQQQNRSESFTLTLDFAPVLTGEMQNMERGVAIFSELENGVLGYDAAVSGGNSGAYVSAAGKTSQKVYLAASVFRDLSVSDGVALKQVGVWYKENGNGTLSPYRGYEMTVQKGTSNAETYTVRVSYSADDYEEFELTVDFTPGYSISGDFRGTRGVILFTDMADDSFICDSSTIMQWGDTAGEHMYVSSGNVPSDKVYLAVNRWDTLSVDGPGILSEKIGTVPVPCRDGQESWIETYNVYELTVKKPADGGMVNHTVTRSWTWHENGEEHNGSDSFTLHLDFSPELSAGTDIIIRNRGVGVFTKLDKNVLTHDFSMYINNGYDGGMELLCLDRKAQTVYLSLPVNHRLTINGVDASDVLTQVGVWPEVMDDGYVMTNKIYKLTVNKPTDGDVVEYALVHSWTYWENNTPVVQSESFKISFTFSQKLSGQVEHGNWDVGVFTGLNKKQLTSDDNIMQWWDTIYVSCDDVESYTVYLTEALYSNFTLTPQGGGDVIREKDMDLVGVWIDDMGQPKKVYALTVDAPANGTTASYGAERSWNWYDEGKQEMVEECMTFDMIFDFAPVFSGEPWVGNSNVFTFSELKNGVLVGDNTITGAPFGQMILCGGTHEKTVYLASGVNNELTVSLGSVAQDLEYVGAWKLNWENDGESGYEFFNVYKLTVNDSNSDLVNLTVTRNWEYYDDKGTWDNPEDDEIIQCSDSFPMTFDFFLYPDQMPPLFVNGLRIYGFCDDEGWLGYMNGETRDEMAFNPNTGAVQVPGRPNQDKEIYLVSTKDLTLAENTVNATLAKLDVPMANGYSVYRLTVPAKDNGNSVVTVTDGTVSTTFNVWFTAVVFNRTSFYTTENLSYVNRETCDGLSVEWLDIGDDSHHYLSVPFNPSQDKVLYIEPNDGAITSVEVLDGVFAENCEFEELESGVYKLTIKEGQPPVGNVMLMFYTTDDRGNEQPYGAVDILFQAHFATLSATDYKVNLFENWETTVDLEDCLYDITRAEFENETLDDLFDIAVGDDGELTITLVGTPEGNDWAAWSKEFAGKQKSVLKLYYNETEFCLGEEMIFTFTATLPKVTAGAVKFNSFLTGDTQQMAFTVKNAVVESVAVNTNKDNPTWVTLTDDQTLTLVNGNLENDKGSGKLNLLVDLEGYRAPAEVVVSVSAAYSAPKLKLSASSVSLVGKYEYQEPVKLALLSGDKNFDINKVTHLTVDNDGYIVNYLGAGEFTLDTAKNPDSGKINLIVTVAGGAKTITVPLTVKVVAPTVKANPTKVTLNPVMHNSDKGLFDTQSVVLSASMDGAWLSADNVSWEIYDKSGKVELPESTLNCAYNAETKTLTIGTVDGMTAANYKVKVVVGGVAKTTDITVTVKETLPKLKVSAKSLTLNHAMGAGCDVQVIELLNDDMDYSNGQVGHMVMGNGIEGAGLGGDVNENALAIYTLNGTLPGKYTVAVTYTLPNGHVVGVPVNVKVEEKLPTLKPDNKALSLEATHGIATVNIDGLDGFSFDGLVAESTVDGITVEKIDRDSFTVKINENLDKKGGKINVYYKLSDAVKTKPVAITVKPVAAITATASAKGNMDVIRPESTSTNFSFKYTGWYPGEYGEDAPTLIWEVSALNGKIPVGMIASGTICGETKSNDGWFKNVSGEPYGVTLMLDTSEDSDWAKGEVNPKYTYNVQFKLDFGGDSEPIVLGKAVKMTVKQGSAKFVAPKTVMLGEEFAITCADDTMAPIAKIAIAETAAKPSQFEIIPITDGDGNETGEYRVAWKVGYAPPANAKSSTVKVNVWLEGTYVDGCENISDTKSPSYRKPNATVSLKVTMQ